MKKNYGFKMFTVIALVMAMLVSIVGCSSSQNDTKKDDKENVSNEQPKDSNKKSDVTIELFQFKLEIAKALDEAVAEYMEENPNVKINVQSIGEGYSVQLKAKMQSGKEPTIFNVGGPSDVNDWSYKLEDLSDQPWVQHAAVGTLGGVTIDDKVYGLPYSVEGYGFVYNKAMFEAADVDVSAIKDFATLEAAVKELDGKIKSGELKEQFPDLEAVFELPAKETWLTGQHTTNIALSPELGSALNAFNAKKIDYKYSDQLKKIVDLQANYSSDADNKQKLCAVDNTTSVENGIAIGRVAMVQQGNWIYPSVNNVDQEIAQQLDILPIPLEGVIEDSIPIGVPMYWTVNVDASDEQKKAAKDFLNWLYQSEKGKEIIVNEFFFIPPFTNYEGLEAKDCLSRAVQRYTNEEKTMPWVFMGYPSGWCMDIMGTSIQKYLAGVQDWDEAIEYCKEQWEELAKDNAEN
ncbi:ABC transporter substrate-binding protein [Vallitalea longa]|uniref:ABC transporter substrate-binding protein n=1 Tax=Vallitalea longa TaxID=2936439 RepID=A0A9W5YCZ5_9FIRM|nr:ABC transporter substrate-binding protein [Vallitalea longa]GKX31197.1 ABC transporter substrate-binding protein [Vallitalea longa]